MLAKLMTKIFASTIRPQKLNLFVTMIFYLILKFFELFKGFRLMLHQVDIAIPTQIISKSHEVEIPTPCGCVHWTTYITMYYFQQFTRPFRMTRERRLGHFSHQASFTCVK